MRKSKKGIADRILYLGKRDDEFGVLPLMVVEHQT